MDKGKGYLLVRVRTGGDGQPVPGAHVLLLDRSGKSLFETRTDAGGNTEPLALPAPDAAHTLDPEYDKPAYSVWNVKVMRNGFAPVYIYDVEVVDTQTSILPVRMAPPEDAGNPTKAVEIHIPPMGLLLPDAVQEGPTRPARPEELARVLIPDTITVHLGAPDDAAAENIRIGFADYIKNVASGEIYPTWPSSALAANIHAIVTLALNRIRTRWYRGRGFDFDITGDIAYDQHYRDGGQIFETIGKIVDEVINIYVRRRGIEHPCFTCFCNGNGDECEGLLQWETVALAEQGLTPLQILRRYYPKDIELAACGAGF